MPSRDAFDKWVADTVADLSGIRSEHPCGLQRKCALTCADRQAGCVKGVFDIFTLAEKIAFSRLAAVAPTNLHMLH